MVGASVVNGNSNGLGELGGDLGSAELLKSESTSELGLDVVLLGLSAHDGSERT